MQAKIKLLYEDSKMPTKANPADIGWDVYIHSIIYDEEKLYHRLKFGIAITPPDGYFFELIPRSSFSNSGFVMANKLGVIDPQYTGELEMRVRKINQVPGFDFQEEERVAQLVLRKIEDKNLQWNIVDDLDITNRNKGGFGSSGKF